MSKKTQSQLTPDGKLIVQDPIRMATTTTTSVATPQIPDEQLPESEVADYWEELNGKRQRSHEDDDDDGHWFPEEAPTSRKRWEELPESTTRKSGDPSEEQVMIDLDRRLSGEQTGSILDLLPERWSTLDPEAVLERIGKANQLQLLPTMLQNEIKTLRDTVVGMYRASAFRWDDEKMDAFQRCSDSITWHLLDAFFVIALKMEYSYVDTPTIRRTLQDMRERLRQREPTAYISKLRRPSQGYALWSTMIHWARQLLKTEDTARRGGSRATGGRGQGSYPAGRGSGFDRGNGSRGGFRGNRVTNKV